MTEKEIAQRTLWEWESELKYLNSLLNDPKSSADDKKYAAERAKVAQSWIDKIHKKYPDLK